MGIARADARTEIGQRQRDRLQLGSHQPLPRAVFEPRLAVLHREARDVDRQTFSIGLGLGLRIVGRYEPGEIDRAVVADHGRHIGFVEGDVLEHRSALPDRGDRKVDRETLEADYALARRLGDRQRRDASAQRERVDLHLADGGDLAQIFGDEARELCADEARCPPKPRKRVRADECGDHNDRHPDFLRYPHRPSAEELFQIVHFSKGIAWAEGIRIDVAQGG